MRKTVKVNLKDLASAIVLTVILMALFLVGILSTTTTVDKPFHWEERPVVIVCSDAPEWAGAAFASAIVIAEAELGLAYTGFYKADCPSNLANMPYGAPMVALKLNDGTLEDSQVAATAVMVDYGKIDQAVILVREEQYKSFRIDSYNNPAIDILLHELLHTEGFLHAENMLGFEVYGHVMSDTYESGGHDWTNIK